MIRKKINFLDVSNIVACFVTIFACLLVWLRT